MEHLTNSYAILAGWMGEHQPLLASKFGVCACQSKYAFCLQKKLTMSDLSQRLVGCVVVD